MHIQVKGVCFSYGSVPVLENVTFKVHSGEVLGIVGPNGSGKSTLLRCLARVLRPRVGTIFLDGKNLTLLPGREVGRYLGYVPPPGAGQAFPCTVLEAILQGRRPHLTWGVTQRDLAAVSRALAYLGLTGLEDRQLGELSSGQRQKVFIARALAQEPEVFLLDEPTATLDVRYQLEVLALMQELAKNHGRVVIVVLHDLNLAGRYSDHLILLHQGRIFAAGTPRTVLTAENIKMVYGVEAVINETPWGLQVMPLAPVNGREEDSLKVCELLKRGAR